MQPPHRVLSDLGIRRCRHEIAAQCDEYLGLAVNHGVDRGHDVVAVSTWRLETKGVLETVEELRCRLLGDSNGPVALHVGVSADRARACAWPPDISAHEEKIDDLLYRFSSMTVLGNSHSPYADDRLGIGVDGGSRRQIVAFQPGLLLNDIPRS